VVLAQGVDNAEAGEDVEAELTGASDDYDYLLGMPMWSLTLEKVW
jgi:hypothetical protein